MKLLYLIGLALHEDFNDMVELNKSSNKLNFSFIQKAEKTGIKQLLQNTINLPNFLNGMYKASAEWTLNYYSKIAELKLENSDLSNLIKVTFFYSTREIRNGLLCRVITCHKILNVIKVQFAYH